MPNRTRHEGSAFEPSFCSGSRSAPCMAGTLSVEIEEAPLAGFPFVASLLLYRHHPPFRLRLGDKARHTDRSDWIGQGLDGRPRLNAAAHERPARRDKEGRR